MLSPARSWNPIRLLSKRVSTASRCSGRRDPPLSSILALLCPSLHFLLTPPVVNSRQQSCTDSQGFLLRHSTQENLRTTSSHSRPSVRLSLSSLSQTSTSSTFHHQQHPFCGHASSTRSLSIRPFLLSRTAAASFRGPLDPSCSIYSWPRLALQAAASLTYRPSPHRLALSSSSSSKPLS